MWIVDLISKNISFISFSFSLTSHFWVCMGLRSCRITKREVRNPTRKYARRMVIPKSNGKQPYNSTRTSTIAAMSTEPIPLNVNIIAIPTMTVALSTLPEGTILSPITQSHPVTSRPIMETEARPFAINFTMPVLGREHPYGMPTSMMGNLQSNPVTIIDSAANMYSPILASGSAIGNHSQPMPPQMGMRFGSQEMPTFMMNSVMGMRQQMNESNHDMINTRTQ